MINTIDVRPALPGDLEAILDELELGPGDTGDPFAGRALWYGAALSASFRYLEWAQEDEAAYAQHVAQSDAVAIANAALQRASNAAGRKDRRIRKAAKEGRPYQPRQSLKHMSPEDKRAHRREQKRLSRKRIRNGGLIEDHPLHGRFD